MDEMIRKMEHVINELDLISLEPSKVTYDIPAVLDNVYVIESEQGYVQGPAFYLNGIGFVTCAHCVLHRDTGQIRTDLVIFRGRDLNTKVSISVIRHNRHMDIALLEIPAVSTSILGEGMTKGNSDELDYQQDIVEAGFPNYNFGDTGYFTVRRVTGFRTISGVNHVLVGNSLVEGNSGGPASNAGGEVFGIAATGAEHFRDAHRTEWHGVTPINKLAFL